MAKKRRHSSSDSSESSSFSEEEDVKQNKKRNIKGVISKAMVSSSDSDSSSDDDDEWNAKPKKTKAKPKARGRPPVKKAQPPPKKPLKKQKSSDSESNSDSGSASDSSSSSNSDDASESDHNEDQKRRAKAPASKTQVTGSKSANNRTRFEEKEEGELVDDLESFKERYGIDIDDIEDDDLDPDQMVFDDGYDENLIGNEEDQRKLAQMTEMEREKELFARSERRAVLTARFEVEKKLARSKLAMRKEQREKRDRERNDGGQSTSEVKARAKTNKVDKLPDSQLPSQTRRETSDEALSAFIDPTTRSFERRRNMEDKRKKDAIKGLQAEREKKKLKQRLRAADVYSDDSDSGDDRAKKSGKSSSDDEDGSSSSGSDDDSDGKSRTKSNRRRSDDWDKEKGDYQEKFEFTIEHLNSIRLSRFKMEKWCHSPFFKDTVVGCFVRIGIGNIQNQVPVYTVGQITEVVETPKIYLLGKTRTNKGIKLKHARAPERIYRLEYISNQEFTSHEFEKWYTKMIADRCDFPSREFVEKKKLAIQTALNYQYSDADIEQEVAEKWRFKKLPVNFAMKKSQLMKEREYAELNGDHDRAMELGVEIDRLEDEAKRREKIRTQNIAAISFINERNRMKNIKEAERAIAESAKEAQNNKDDPFTRRKCAPTMISVFGKGKTGNVDSATATTTTIETVGNGTSGNSQKQSPVDPNSDGSKDSVDSSEVKPMLAPKQVASKNGIATKSNNNNNAKETTGHGDSDDLFSAHNFEIKIDFDLPSTSHTSAAFSSGGGFITDSGTGAFSNGTPVNGFGSDGRAGGLVNRRSLNLDEYKKKKGLI